MQIGAINAKIERASPHEVVRPVPGPPPRQILKVPAAEGAEPPGAPSLGQRLAAGRAGSGLGQGAGPWRAPRRRPDRGEGVQCRPGGSLSSPGELGLPAGSPGPTCGVVRAGAGSRTKAWGSEGAGPGSARLAGWLGREGAGQDRGLQRGRSRCPLSRPSLPQARSKVLTRRSATLWPAGRVATDTSPGAAFQSLPTAPGASRALPFSSAL